MALVAAWHVGSSRPGIKPMSPALADGFFTTEPPGKPCFFNFYFLASLDLPCRVQSFSSYGDWGLISSCSAQASLLWFLLLQNTGSKCVGFSSRGTQPQWLRCTGLVALWHLGSSETRIQALVPCTGRWIPNHWTTRKVPISIF